MRNDSGRGGASDTRVTDVPPLYTPYFWIIFRMVEWGENAVFAMVYEGA